MRFLARHDSSSRFAVVRNRRIVLLACLLRCWRGALDAAGWCQCVLLCVCVCVMEGAHCGRRRLARPSAAAAAAASAAVAASSCIQPGAANGAKLAFLLPRPAKVVVVVVARRRSLRLGGRARAGRSGRALPDIPVCNRPR